MSSRREFVSDASHACGAAIGLGAAAMTARSASTSLDPMARQSSEAAERYLLVGLVVEADFEGKGAQFTNPALTAATMGWATRILVV